MLLQRGKAGCDGQRLLVHVEFAVDLQLDAVALVRWITEMGMGQSESFIATSIRAVPVKMVMWMSWPQPCMTGTSWPERLVTRAVLA